MRSLVLALLLTAGPERPGTTSMARFEEDPSRLTLRGLAESGSAANNAGAAVVTLLQHPDREIRLAAARTLGYIGDVSAAGALIPLLSETTDVRLNWAAAESLGRLHAGDAIAALNKTASSHWHPAVRQAATAAVQHIQDGSDYVGKAPRVNFSVEFFAYETIGGDLASCKSPAVERIRDDPTKKLDAEGDAETDADADALKALTYDAQIISHAATKEPSDQDPGNPQLITKINEHGIAEQHRSIRQLPSVALRIEGGWLAGSSRGEWGGELVQIADTGAVQTILLENVENIHQLGTRIVVVTGLAHLSSNRGTLYELSRAPDNSWSALLWRALPGAPATSWPTRTGELLVDTVSAGTLLVGADGSMRMAPCADAP